MTPRSLLIASLLAVLTATFLVPAQAQFTAYAVPGAVSNQFITNPLGMEFDVNSEIHITALGVFDSKQDGLAEATPVYIYDRNTQLAVVSELIPSGTPGFLVGGSRFVLLPTPFDLSAGFQGMIAEDPNVIDGNYNTNGVPGAPENTGGGLITFVSDAQVSDNGPGTYPGSESGIPSNRYDAGNFQFVAGAYSAATPEPGTLAWLVGLGIAGSGIIVRRRPGRK